MDDLNAVQRFQRDMDTFLHLHYLMNAYEELGSIIGEAVGEDLVNEIFSKFCTGK